MVEKLGHSAWRSTHIPGSVWDSREAATFYDRQEERKKVAALERVNEELLSQFTPEQIKNLENAFAARAAINSEPEREFENNEVARFMQARPRFMDTAHNFSKLAAYLVGRDLYAPYSAVQLCEAYDALQGQRWLELHPV